MSLLEDVQSVNKYNREGACVKNLMIEKVGLYKILEEGDDPISNLL